MDEHRGQGEISTRQECRSSKCREDTCRPKCLLCEPSRNDGCLQHMLEMMLPEAGDSSCNSVTVASTAIVLMVPQFGDARSSRIFD